MVASKTMKQIAIYIIIYLSSVLYATGIQYECEYIAPEVSSSGSRGVLNANYNTDIIDSTQFKVNSDTNKTVQICPNEHNFCYTLWQYDSRDSNNASLYLILAKGCWDTSTDHECRHSQCISYSKPVKALNNTKFCCCYGHMCNANISMDEFQAFDPSDHQLQPYNRNSEKFNSEENNSLTIAMIAAIFSLAFIIFATAICCRSFASTLIDTTNKKKKNADSLHLLESHSSSSQTSSAICDLDSLKILDVIGRGRYGSVSKGTLNDQTVAVKIFASQYRQYYLNEKDIYTSPFNEYHQCLPRLIGYQERIGADSRIEYQLVLSYAPNGCLQDYLRNHTIDWQTMCKMVQTTTQGLAFLHSEIKKGDKTKPCIAHRDLSSRNIIVNMDASCMICDFQFAIRISGSSYYSNGEMFDSQTASLNDVGTLRYMAPEILEGAVNLRDCESAMKQIDVYALGLVLWEIASRCSDLYQGIVVPSYKQPFEHEVGSHPSFEQMQILVTRHKARPLFPDIWKDSNPAIRSLKETIEDCWDHDAEARLTSLCVEERLMELPLLWERHKTGTLSSCVGAIYSQQSQFSSMNNQKNAFAIKNGSNSVHNIIGGLSSGSQDTNDRLILEIHKKRYMNRLDYPNNNNSTNATEEPLVTFSPSSDFEKNILSAANVLSNQPQLTFGCQPHQGRNPCLERNLMLESSEDEKSTLLEHGLKFQANNTNSDEIANNVFSEINANNDSNVSLVNSDLLGRNINENSTRNVMRRVGNGTLAPIPFVQNTIINTIPKQPNLPGNGHHSIAITKDNLTANNNNNNNSTASRLSKLLRITKIKGWPNFNSLRKSNCENILAEENQPFSPIMDNNEDISVLEGTHIQVAHVPQAPPHPTQPQPQHRNLTMISSPSINNVIDNNEPKSTQVDIINGSPLISIIDINEKLDNNRNMSNIWSNQIQNQCENQNSVSIDDIKCQLSRPTNIEAIYYLDDRNLSSFNDSSDCCQTQIKESSLKCDQS